jgi:hypothetical protein
MIRAKKHQSAVRPYEIKFDDDLLLCDELDRFMITPEREIIHYSLIEEDILLTSKGIITRESYNPLSRAYHKLRLGKVYRGTPFIKNMVLALIDWQAFKINDRPRFMFTQNKDVALLDGEEAWFIYKHMDPRQLDIYRVTRLKQNNMFKPRKNVKHDLRQDIRESFEEDSDFQGYDF